MEFVSTMGVAEGAYLFQKTVLPCFQSELRIVIMRSIHRSHIDDIDILINDDIVNRLPPIRSHLRLTGSLTVSL